MTSAAGRRHASVGRALGCTSPPCVTAAECVLNCPSDCHRQYELVLGLGLGLYMRVVKTGSWLLAQSHVCDQCVLIRKMFKIWGLGELKYLFLETSVLLLFMLTLKMTHLTCKVVFGVRKDCKHTFLLLVYIFPKWKPISGIKWHILDVLTIPDAANSAAFEYNNYRRYTHAHLQKY